jgi:Ca2+-binding EF-hand superfamily protein
MDKPASGLNLTVMYYFLPQGYIGNTMFRVLDQNRDGLLSSEEFVNGLSVLYFGEFEDKLRFIFNMYDYDSDGTITCEDIRLMLSYIPIGTLMPQSQIKEGILTSSTTHSSYFERVQIQKQIIELFKITLKDKLKINFTEFKNIIENDSSDMFLCVFLVVRQSLPSMKNFMNYKSDYKMSPIDQKPSIIASPKMTKLSPTLEVLRVSPNMVHRSIINESNPFLKYFKSRSIEIENTIKSNSKTISDELPRDISIPIMKTQPSTFLLSKVFHNENCVRIPNITIVDKNFKKSEQSVKIDYTESPTSFLAQASTTQLGLCICKCGRFCETGNTICKLCLKSNEIEGYLYTQLSEYKLKKYWYKLKGDELFCIHLNRL